MTQSSRPGMGARAYEGGVSFRVWAPFAEKVAVAGDFNDWSPSAHPLTNEGNGFWSADVPGARVGQQYKYVITNGSTYWRNDPYAQEMTNSAGTSLIHDPSFDWGNDEFTIPAWNDLVIYEMHIGTFNDDPDPGPGTFRRVLERLPYLRDLGINAIEIMAIGEFPMDISWGYNPSHIYSIEQAYGGASSFKELVKTAHANGIAVLVDVVYNHMGPGDLDLWQFDGWQQNGKGGAYFYNDDRARTPWGHTRPDYGRPEVRQFLRDNALMWLEQYRVDGLRWDATGWIRNIYGGADPSDDIPEGWTLMQWINEEINARHPHKISIAEDLQHNEWITRDVHDGGAGFDAQWDAGFVHPIRATIIQPNDAQRDMYLVAKVICARYNGDAFERIIYTESHDEVANGRARVPEEIWPGNANSWHSRKRSTLGAALVFTSPGIPMIFQGQEFLEDRYFQDTVPLDWGKLERNGGILAMYRDLIRLRRNWYNNTRGLRGQWVNVHHVNNRNKIIAFHRWDQGGPGDDVVVVINMANRSYDNYSVGFPRSGLWKVRFNSDWNGYSSDFGNHLSYDTIAAHAARDGMPYAGNIGIGPYSTIILSQDS